MRPIPNTDDRGSYGKDTPVPGKNNSGRTPTFKDGEPGEFEAPRRPNTENLPKRPGTDRDPIDDGFGPRPGETDAPPPKKPFEANKPELNDPVLPNVPERAPAAPANVKEETPVDAALDLDTKITNRPVLMRDRFVARSRSVTPSRAAYDWSAKPADPRVVRK